MKTIGLEILPDFTDKNQVPVLVQLNPEEISAKSNQFFHKIVFFLKNMLLYPGWRFWPVVIYLQLTDL